MLHRGRDGNILPGTILGEGDCQEHFVAPVCMACIGDPGGDHDPCVMRDFWGKAFTNLSDIMVEDGQARRAMQAWVTEQMEDL